MSEQDSSQTSAQGRRGGRPRKLRASSSWPRIAALATAVKESGGGLADVVGATMPLLVATHTHDLPRIARSLVAMFEPAAPRVRRRSRSFTAAFGRRLHCRYGRGAYVLDASRSAIETNDTPPGELAGDRR